MFRMIALAILFLSATSFAKVVKYGAHVLDPGHLHLPHLAQKYVIDHIHSDRYEVYGDNTLLPDLDQRGINYMVIEDEVVTISEFSALSDYPSPQEINQQLKEIASLNPSIAKIVSIGTSVQGIPLLVLKISDNVHHDEVEPEVKYIANMHGDEIMGRELLVRFARQLVTNYPTDTATRNLINDSEIYLMPSMNPDGAASHRRGNANWIDLNRDFPDFTTPDNQNEFTGRARETQAVMKFQQERNFVLSANFHGGAEVVNYPWDTTPDSFPLHDLAHDLSVEYAGHVHYLSNSRRFQNGVTNGYRWYPLNGGMQDWSYHWHNDLQVTIEVSYQKWPMYSEVEGYYSANKKALFEYLKRGQQGLGFKTLHRPESGQVTYISGDMKLGPYPFRRGEHYKVLPAGNWELRIQREGNADQSLFGYVAKNQARGRYLPLRD